MREMIASQYFQELTQAEVAKKLGRHQPFIANIESGQRRLDVVEFLQVAAVINLDPHATIRTILKIPDQEIPAQRKAARNRRSTTSIR